MKTKFAICSFSPALKRHRARKDESKTALEVKYEYNKNGDPELIKLPEVRLVDDKTSKQEGINMIIGRRPNTAFGNSTGDQRMLEYTRAATECG